MQPIHRIFAIDWSGAIRGARQRIWLSEVAAGTPLRLENGRSRDDVVDHLIAEARRDPSLVVGLDFAFSFPAGFLRKRAHREVGSVWEEAAVYGEDWLAHCPSPPFWGKPGKRKPAFGEAALHRETERAVAKETGARPLSVFQIGGAGAVGVGSIRGMPLLLRLRAEGFSIWPFDEPRLPLVVEIWPRVFMGSVRKSRIGERRSFLASRYPQVGGSLRDAAERSDDAFDALVSALEMDRHRRQLGGLTRAQKRTVVLEGEIWRPGVV